MEAYFTTPLGTLYEGDLIEVLPQLEGGQFDAIFADPPFNIKKVYGKRVNDDLPEQQYLDWCRAWLRECVRVLRPGGALFVYNLPKWNMVLGAFLSQELGLEFRHWVSVEMKASFPIQGKLYPSHYSLLYFTRGKPSKFNRVRVPIAQCRHCQGEIPDYGGHRSKMNPNGVNLSDVWGDISTVRHKKFKSGKRVANQLSTKLVRRCLEISTDPGDRVLDCFGGSGTTFDVCERTGRYWVGVEIENCDVIVERISTHSVLPHPYDDHVERK